MDKAWIDFPTRVGPEYMKGIDAFLEFAYSSRPEGSYISCPCRNCANRYNFSREVVRGHLYDHGFLKKYKKWTHHGEPYIRLHGNHLSTETLMDATVGDNMVGMIHGVFRNPQIDPMVEEDDRSTADPHVGPDEETTKYLKLLEDAQSELYPECSEFTALSFIVHVLHMKVLNKWSDKSVDMLLELLNKAFPSGLKLPNSYYHAQKITDDLGFTYETWDACANSCMLFRKEHESLDACLICGSSRWKLNDAISNGNRSQTRTPAKQIRYFPLKPRLQRYFMSAERAELMRWHTKGRIKDGALRHPADSLEWQDLDRRHPEFASDNRNIRLGLASDGFNPFRSMNIVHSTWPVVIIPYNFPPWLCMKQPFLILSVLIDGPKGPGDKIDVYLQPLIEELKELWEEGIPTFDASTNEMFQMHAALLWTISDFPAYANLSGWSTKGEYACPCCNTQIESCWLKHGKKHAYMGHRRFLPMNHKFRRDQISFNGKREWESKPRLLSGSELLNQMECEGILTQYKIDDLKTRQTTKKRKEPTGSRKHNLKKKSILFELPYWENNLIRHNLDVMHIEKNVCDNVLWTILGVKGKSKDNENARRDLQEMNIRKPLHLQPRGAKKAYVPPAQFTMAKEEKDVILKVLKEIKVPGGYSSNISRRVRLIDRSIGGLKSHDNHVLMQQLIPLAIRKSMPKEVVETLMELSNFFRKLCSKNNTRADLLLIQARIGVTLCHLEKLFPPAFFDIMEHLPIHLADEALVGGAVQFRWMYPIERFLLTLKQYVRNREHPEGSMANGYLMEECMDFCAQYLKDVETKSNRPKRNDDGDDHMGRGVGEDTRFFLDDNAWIQAHRYVLCNTKSIEPFIEEHLKFLKRQMPRADNHYIRREHLKEFHKWFKEHVQTLRANNVLVPKEILQLSLGPHKLARRYNGYVINGFRFRVKTVDDNRSTQNSGVALKAETMSYASRKDKNPRSGVVYYYGRLTDVIEIRYTNDLTYTLFKCDWVDNVHGKKEDKFKFTLVNFSHLLYKDNQSINEPFISASQAEQVWYIQDPEEPNWQVVVKMSQRGVFDTQSFDPQAEPYMSQHLEENVIMLRDEDVGWVREELEGEIVDV